MFRLALFIAVLMPLLGQGQSPARKGLDVDRTIDILLADDFLRPASIRIEEGRYRFRIHNGLTPAALLLRLDDDKNARIRETPGRAHSGRTELIENLKPGRYTLYVAQRPKWRVAVEVTEKRR